MLNGADKNWIRLLAALNGFHVDHGHWPKWVRMPEVAIEELRDHILGPEGFELVNGKVALIPDHAFIAEDQQGNSYDYSSRGFPDEKPSPDAFAWLDVWPQH